MKTRDKERQGYGNIYTPHAGSMIIQVQREGGLANRTIVLGPRQVSVLRFLNSATGKIFLALGALAVVLLAAQAARTIPLMTAVKQYEADSHRIDSLQTTLSQLSKNYEQLQMMLGAAPPAPVVGPTKPDSAR